MGAGVGVAVAGLGMVAGRHRAPRDQQDGLQGGRSPRAGARGPRPRAHAPLLTCTPTGVQAGATEHGTRPMVPQAEEKLRPRPLGPFHPGHREHRHPGSPAARRVGTRSGRGTCDNVGSVVQAAGSDGGFSSGPARPARAEGAAEEVGKLGGAAETMGDRRPARPGRGGRRGGASGPPATMGRSEPTREEKDEGGDPGCDPPIRDGGCGSAGILPRLEVRAAGWHPVDHERAEVPRLPALRLALRRRRRLRQAPPRPPTTRRRRARRPSASSPSTSWRRG